MSAFWTQGKGLVMDGTAVKALVTLSLGMLVAVPAAEAQQPGKVYRVGILGDKASDPVETRLWQVFRLGLRERGWIEGGNILIEPRWAEGNFARLPELVAEGLRTGRL